MLSQVHRKNEGKEGENVCATSLSICPAFVQSFPKCCWRILGRRCLGAFSKCCRISGYEEGTELKTDYSRGDMAVVARVEGAEAVEVVAELKSRPHTLL